METSTTKQSVKDYEILDDTPPWAIALFDKMKSEICAEVHAKIAYTVRIMLDGMVEEIKASLSPIPNAESNTEVCPCRDPRKCRPCNEKRAAQRMAYYAQKKEEKKLAKMVYKENKKLIRKSKYLVMTKSSGSESETGGSGGKKKSCRPQQIHQQAEAPPIPPRKMYPTKPVEEMKSVVITLEEDEPKILNNSGCMEMMCSSNIYEPDSSTSPIETLSPTKVDNALPITVSDSEFEVVSMPRIDLAAGYVRVAGDNKSPLMSDIESNNSSDDDDDLFNTEPETECEVNSTTSKPTLSDLCSGKGGSLYPELELKKMTLSMASSANSALLDDYLSSCSHEEQTVGAVGGPMERERAPYSGIPGDLEKKVEVVRDQPLPCEFSRDRHPYSQVSAQRTTGIQQQKPESIKEAPKQAHRDPKYRVDHLPESLWDEAMTVAAQTYNAAKTAVENLADSFVPGIDVPAKAATPRPPSAQQMPPPPKAQMPVGLTKLEQKLFEMGFTNCSLNSTLLARHNYDIEKVVAELIDP